MPALMYVRPIEQPFLLSVVLRAGAVNREEQWRVMSDGPESRLRVTVKCNSAAERACTGVKEKPRRKGGAFSVRFAEQNPEEILLLNLLDLDPGDPDRSGLTKNVRDPRRVGAPGIDTKRKAPGACATWGFCVNPGDDRLSHKVPLAVPWALEGLTTVFGMGTGVAPPV